MQNRQLAAGGTAHKCGHDGLITEDVCLPGFISKLLILSFVHKHALHEMRAFLQEFVFFVC